MATLEKRVQVLFDPARYAELEAAAKAVGMSVGAFIRSSVEQRIQTERNARVSVLEGLFARADADPRSEEPFDWAEAKADWENQMDPMWRLTHDVFGNPK